MEYLFVYGSLAQGRKNAHQLEVIGGDWIPATVRGRLENQGWGSIMGYPGLIIDGAGDEIEGFVFCSAYLRNHWKRLDEFEGAEYARASVTAKLTSGEIIEAHVYALK